LASDTAKRTFRLFKKYTQKNCVIVCLDDIGFEKCKVQRELHFSKISLIDQLCIETFLGRSYNSSLLSTCLEKCPIECNTVKYTLSASSAAYPSESFKRLMNIYFNALKSLSFANLSEHEDKILAVNIFYKVTSFWRMVLKPGTGFYLFIWKKVPLVGFSNILFE